MKLPLVQLWRSFRASYWAVPSLMVVLAIVLGAVMIWLDSGPASGVLDGIGWYQKSKPEGAREVLSAIAGSMITVAGVVFSITIVAISFAANQYGPRILTNFMSDRGNQVTLGTFIATFVYSVVVLRTIYGGEEDFVPQLAVMVAMLLALCSIIVLIYFIHHVPRSIHINTITSQIGRQLIASVSERFPARFGDPPDQSDAQKQEYARRAETAFANGNARAIECRANGYLQALDEDALMAAACAHDLLICVKRSPGHFVYRGRTIALAAPADRVGKEAADAIRRSFSTGSRRTPDQDLLFLVDELVEIAARALSTGVNDPYTAMTCIDWLTAAAAELAARQPPSPYRLGDDGSFRVLAPTGGLGLLVERGFGRLRPYAAGDPNAATHFASRLRTLAGECRTLAQIQALENEAEAMSAMARAELDGPSLAAVEQEVAAARSALAQARLALP